MARAVSAASGGLHPRETTAGDAPHGRIIDDVGLGHAMLAGKERVFMVQRSSDDGTMPEAEQRGLRLGGGAIASLTGGAALVIFMIQNTDDVTVKFLAWEFTWPIWLLVLVSALIGAVVWLGLGVLRRHRRRKERREDRRD
jgi:uncharacterized integral membrane protein